MAVKMWCILSPVHDSLMVGVHSGWSVSPVQPSGSVFEKE